MSDQFYKYLSNRIIEYFKNGNVFPGDRFFIELDQKTDSLYLFDEISKSCKEVTYPISNGYEFKGNTIHIGELRILVVQTLETIKPDFLVTLRNKVSEQLYGWENTCLLFILYETLDSIKLGSRDLTSKGFPLNFESIKENLSKEISENISKESDKSILEYELSLKHTDKYIRSSLTDYKDILSCVQRKALDQTDFENFGMFIDDGLSDIVDKIAQENRIKQNKEYFRVFNNAFETGNHKQIIDLIGINRKEEVDETEWTKLDYKKVQNWVNDNSENIIKLSFKDIIFSDSKKINYKNSNKTPNEYSVMILTENHDGKIYINFDNELKEPRLSNLKKANYNYKFEGFSIIIDISTESQYYFVDFQDLKYKNSRYKFHIIITDLNESIFSKFQDRIFVNAKDSILKIDGFDSIYLGEDFRSEVVDTIKEENQVIFFSLEDDYKKIEIDDTLCILENLRFKIQFDNNQCLELEFNENNYTPKVITSIFELDEEIRIKKQSLMYDYDKKLVVSPVSKYSILSDNIITHLNLEYEFLSNKCTNISDSNYVNLDLPEPVSKKFYELLEYFSLHKTVPSLAYLSDELQKLYKEYIDSFMNHLNSIKKDTLLDKITKNLSKLATVKIGERVEFSPLHPIVVEHKLLTNKLITNERVEIDILKKLIPNNLVPYIYNENNLCLENSTNPDLPNWVFFNPLGLYNTTEENLYTSNLVFDKIVQFKTHFDYLFLDNANCPILINLVDIVNDQDILVGILKYIIYEMNNNDSFESINSIIVRLYGKYEKTSFDLVSQINSIDELDSSIYKQIINEKVNDIDLIDILNTFQKKLFYYKYSDEQFEYAHLSFVKINASNEFRKNKLQDFENGFQLGGSISTLSSTADGVDFRISVGNNNSINSNFSRNVYKLNEFYANMALSGENSYEENSVLSTTISSDLIERMKKIYDASNWVSFINPDVDYSFFKKTQDDLLIIHYSDQLTSFKKFDSITVTNKSNQYLHILKQYLSKFSSKLNEELLSNAIRSFNCINGEWLLKSLVNDNRGMIYGKEKLSILSAIKYTLSILDVEDILWVPISLEEIIRVTRASKLETLKSAFSVKKLKENGSMSDDILMFGFHRVNGEIHCYLYPVEVKVGKVKSDTEKKAKEQVKNIIQIFKKHLIENYTFEAKYYKNLFVQLALSNYELMKINNFWSDKKFEFTKDDNIRFAEGNFEFNYGISNYIGEGAIVTFKNDLSFNEIHLNDSVMHINLMEVQAYSGIYVDLNSLNSEIHNDKTDFDSSSKYFLKNRIMKENTLQRQNILPINEEIKNENSMLDKEKEETEINLISTPIDVNANSEISNNGISGSEIIDLRDVRVLIGKIQGSNKELYWEFGNKQLPNRHMLISGASGQGKTYLIQCLLLELANKNISSIIFDYTQGFTLDKLESEFVEKLDNRINEEVVFIDKVSVNPFKKQKIYGNYDETSIQIAQRITDIFSHVYELGDQQKSYLYQACKNGVDNYGDRMSMSLLEKELENMEAKEAKSVLSKFKPFFDSNFFKSDSEFNWDSLLYSKGKVNIIQLMNINSFMQTIITELILWDIWYYVQKNGSEETPFVAVLDEAQNLSFEKDSPASKILTEGRKFGWSALFATQFLKGQLKQDEISRLLNANQKLYFLPPQNEVQDISSRITNDSEMRKDIESKLRQLEKGKCLFDGLQNIGDKLQKLNPSIVQITSLSNRKNN